LLVDDEPQIVDMEKQLLEKLGYRVTGRTSSTEALETFAGQPDQFDLVITDMTMPQMTGDRPGPPGLDHPTRNPGDPLHRLQRDDFGRQSHQLGAFASSFLNRSTRTSWQRPSAAPWTGRSPL